MIAKTSLLPGEELIFNLRSLYDGYGYKPYKMNKFEEYDLYAHNKDFLISDGVITFTDTNGKLMALKPDVTLSIVKNTKDSQNKVEKLYYNESVYRVSKGTKTFKEIMQVGLEALGDIDDYCIYEVMSLAAKSLSKMKHNYVLEISHLGILSQFLEKLGIPMEEKEEVFALIAEKNLHELTQLCGKLNIPEKNISLLKELISLYGPIDTVLEPLVKLLTGQVETKLLEQFITVLKALSHSELKDCFCVDFSVVDDIHYYNGFVFKGFLEGVPSSILSGGEYGKLMKKMKREASAIGFAVYPDMLECFLHQEKECDVDVVLLYEESTSLLAVQEKVEQLQKEGLSVLVQKQLCDDLTYKKCLKI